MLFRRLYESWLMRSTGEPLAPWQRARLLRALQKDAALRQLAIDLAEFSHESQAPAEDRAPDLRVRLVHLALDSEIEAPADAPQSRWVLAGLAAALLAGLISLDAWMPTRDGAEVARVQQPAEALALAIPTATPTATVAPEGGALNGVSASAGAQILPSATAPPKP